MMTLAFWLSPIEPMAVCPTLIVGDGGRDVMVALAEVVPDALLAVTATARSVIPYM